MITESPDPIKDRSELVFTHRLCKVLPPSVLLSEHSGSVTRLINALFVLYFNYNTTF